MNIRWIICILLSLALHCIWLTRSDWLDVKPQKTASPLVVVHPMPETAPEPKPLTVEKVKLSKNTDEEKTPPRFQPNEKPRDKTIQEQKGEAKNDIPTKTTDSPKPVNTASIPTATESKTEVAEKNKEYRRRLLMDFEEDWQKVPDLNTTIEDHRQIADIDRHFGIIVIAYGFVDQKPSPPFLIFRPDQNNFEKIDDFDFSRYSNRIKDRMLSPDLRQKLDQAARQYGIDSMMKVIGLVPADTDRYFAAKQVRAAEIAGASLDGVMTTYGHYEKTGSGGFNLIIDSIQLKDSRIIPVKDEELRFAAAAPQSNERSLQ